MRQHHANPPAKGPSLSRRGFVGAAAATGLLATRRARAAGSEVPITMVINQSPWLDGFVKTVDRYEKETGNHIELDVQPFAGSMEKQRSSVRSSEGHYDLLPMNASWFAEMYFGGFLTPIHDIDPDFKLDPGIYSFGDSIYFDPATKTMNAKTGKLMSVPINPNIPLLYYRTDLYKEKSLSVPKTLDELMANAKALNDPPKRYGIVQRGARGNSIAFDFWPYLYGFGGALFKDPKNGDFTVMINDEKGKAALEYYVTLAREAGHPKSAALGQAEVIQSMLTGKAAHIMVVVAAWSQMNDPNKSIVVDKVGLAVPPAQPGVEPGIPLGHFLGGVPHNVPKERQRAAVAFLKWWQTPAAQNACAELGGVPVSKAALEGPLAQKPGYGWMEPLAKGLEYALNLYPFPQGNEVIPPIEINLNQALSGDMAVVPALNGISDQVYAIMNKYGYKTGKLPPLT